MVFLDKDRAADMLDVINEILIGKEDEGIQLDRADLVFVVKPALEYALGFNSNTDTNGIINDGLNIGEVFANAIENFENDEEAVELDEKTE